MEHPPVISAPPLFRTGPASTSRTTCEPPITSTACTRTLPTARGFMVGNMACRSSHMTTAAWHADADESLHAWWCCCCNTWVHVSCWKHTWHLPRASIHGLQAMPSATCPPQPHAPPLGDHCSHHPCSPAGTAAALPPPPPDAAAGCRLRPWGHQRRPGQQQAPGQPRRAAGWEVCAGRLPAIAHTGPGRCTWNNRERAQWLYIDECSKGQQMHQLAH